MGPRRAPALCNRARAQRTEVTSERIDAAAQRGEFFVERPHPATLDEVALLKACKWSVGRVSGPGGQHRNRVATAVFVTHVPTAVEAQGTERRSQIENRKVAFHRLRVRLAVLVRTPVALDPLVPSECWIARRRERRIQVSAAHWDYPTLLAEALDVSCAVDFDLARAAQLLGISSSQLTGLIRQDKFAGQCLNAWRTARGLRPVRD